MTDHDGIVIGTSDATATSTRNAKGKPTRTAKGKPAESPRGKRSLNLSLPYEDYQRLALHALDQDTTMSEIVSSLARTHLRSVHLTRTSTRPTDTRE